MILLRILYQADLGPQCSLSGKSKLLGCLSVYLTEPLREKILSVLRNVAYHHIMIYEERRHAPNHGSKHLEVLIPQRKIFRLLTKFRNRLLQTPEFARTNFSPMAIYAATRTAPGQAYCLTKS